MTDAQFEAILCCLTRIAAALETIAKVQGTDLEMLASRVSELEKLNELSPEDEQRLEQLKSTLRSLRERSAGRAAALLSLLPPEPGTH
jgi:hypothetical protein